LVGLEVVPSVVALALPLKVPPSVIRMRGAIADLEEAFFEEGCGRRDLERGDSNLNKSIEM